MNADRIENYPKVLMLSLLCIAFMLSSIDLRANTSPPGPPDPGHQAILGAKVGFDQNLGEKVDLSLSFTNESGIERPLEDYLLNDRPFVLVFAYYECPSLCNFILNGLFESLSQLPYHANEDYALIIISIDPRESSALASKKKQAYLEKYQKVGHGQGIHFLTGDKQSISHITRQVGFRYTYDRESDEYIHAAGAILTTFDGTISRYLYGIEFPKMDLRLGLIEASQNKVGRPVDHLLLYCYRYDPVRGSYSFAIFRTLQIAGGFTVLGLACLIGGQIRSELRKKRAFGLKERL